MRFSLIIFPCLAVLVVEAFAVITIKHPYGKPYDGNPYSTEDYNPPPKEEYIPDDEPVKYGNDVYPKENETYYTPPPPPPPYNDYVEDAPYPYVTKDKYADNYKDYGPFITVSTKDPELINHEYVSASQFAEGRCRREAPADNLNATWYWADLQAFLAAGSLSMQLTTRQIWAKEARIPRHRLQFSVLPYPSQGVTWWTILDDIALIQESRDIDQSTNKAVYTNYPADNPQHKHLATRFIEKEHITVVLTDNKNYALLVRCLNDEHRDYMVMSVEPTIRYSHLQLLRNKITELGFSPNYFRVSPDYDHHPN